jgi:hypothetical protein
LEWRIVTGWGEQAEAMTSFSRVQSSPITLYVQVQGYSILGRSWLIAGGFGVEHFMAVRELLMGVGFTKDVVCASNNEW